MVCIRILNKASGIFMKSSYLKLLKWKVTREFSGHLLTSSSECSQRPNSLSPSSTSNSTCLQCCAVDSRPKNIHTTQISAKKSKTRKPVTFNVRSSKKVISVWKNMTVGDLAKALDKTVDEIFEVFLHVEGSDNFDRPSTPISDMGVIMQVVKIAGMRCRIQAAEPQLPDVASALFKDAVRSPPAPPKDLEPRPPIVTIMGHVDHGKTTLLDTLRHSSIVDTEFGGITQHIGAFEVSLPSGEQVTFLDTPGHAAFSAMRARGAHVTDLVVLVVAADDGVCPQTRESLQLAQDAGTPLIVAINKIDKVNADIPRCKQMLLEAGLQLEEQGGDVQAVELSALKGTNVQSIVEALVTQAELMNLRATKKGLVEGVIIESQIDPRKGKIATCIVQRGTLTKGAVVIAGISWAKVRSLFDCSGRPIEKALPGTPVQVIGWKDKLPHAGAELLEVKGERRAREVVHFRESERKKQKSLADLEAIEKKIEDHLKTYKEEREKRLQMGIRRKIFRGRPPLEKQYQDDPRPRVSLVLKGDVDGSVDAILDVLDTYYSEEVLMDILSYGVGSVSSSDVEMAQLFKGIIYTFNVPLAKDIQQLAHNSGVSIREHNIIYRLIEDLQIEISSKLPLKPSEEVVGEATVQQEFLIKERRKKISVAGCRCVKGQLKKDLLFKVVRGENVIHEGPLKAMKHMKQDVNSIKADVECGLMFEDEDVRFETGDSIVCYRINMLSQTTDWIPGGFQHPLKAT